jgi:hypothetical protein
LVEEYYLPSTNSSTFIFKKHTGKKILPWLQEKNVFVDRSIMYHLFLIISNFKNISYKKPNPIMMQSIGIQKQKLTTLPNPNLIQKVK